ncbi:hypothetical protein HPB47_014944 [Ixodes persulcatus]|uniref:Uncharacterized protein n=1 Tax=Ixodes persulcatus TaxID=34615 RepID=A0AC60QUQ4_IXOPE|nr:hypothetical protein HPB47_014944 [Ixodes persulcatus]
MNTVVSLTSGTGGPQTSTDVTQLPTPNVTTIDIQLDTGLLMHLGIAKEDIGKLITGLLVNYAQGTLNLTRSSSPQGAANEEETQASVQTVVLKPICKENVKNFTAREIRRAVAEAGITESYKIQIQPRANTIALTTRDEKITEKLLQVTEVKKDKDSYALKPYKTMGHNQVRGVIYLHGDNSAETPETLVPDLVCRTAKIIFARLMGKTSNAVVITFEGTRLPKNVMFSREIFTVRPYRPRPIVCYNCHGIGHKSDVCPIKESRCGHCGYTYEEDMEQCNREPKCRNCEGHHEDTRENATPKAATNTPTKRELCRGSHGQSKVTCRTAEGRSHARINARNDSRRAGQVSGLDARMGPT